MNMKSTKGKKSLAWNPLEATYEGHTVQGHTVKCK